MKIIVIGKNNIMKWPHSVHRNLCRMGHQSELFLFNKQTFGYCFYRLFGKKYRLKWLTRKFENLIQKVKPDLILFISAFSVPKPFFEIATKYPSIKKAGWVGDRFPQNKKETADLLDALFCSDTGFLDDTKTFKCKSYFLPLCVDESVCKKVNIPKTLLPFFAGVANPLRNEYLKACKVPCLLYGKRWNKKIMPWHEIHNHKIPVNKMYSLIAKSIAPINICFSSNNVNGVNFRVFEIGAMGGLILLNDTKDLHKCYKVGKEAVAYTTPESFNKLIQDIIKAPKKYAKIADAGYKKTLKEHTYISRLEQIIKVLN